MQNIPSQSITITSLATTSSWRSSFALDEIPTVDISICTGARKYDT
jgi:hypothetical protein